MRAYLTLKAALTAFFCVLTFCLLAQTPPGIDDFNSASQTVRSWYFSVSDLVMAIGAIAGILGGTRVYTNWQIGGHHHRHPIDAQVIGWFLSCLFLILAAIFIKALYGV